MLQPRNGWKVSLDTEGREIRCWKDRRRVAMSHERATWAIRQVKFDGCLQQCVYDGDERDASRRTRPHKSSVLGWHCVAAVLALMTLR